MPNVMELDMALLAKVMPDVIAENSKEWDDEPVWHNGLYIPGDNEEVAIVEIVRRHNAKYPEAQGKTRLKLQAQIADLTAEITQLQTEVISAESDFAQYLAQAEKVLGQVSSKLVALQKLFPQRLHDYLVDGFGDKEFLKGCLVRSMGMMDKMFRSKQIMNSFETLYTEIDTLIKSIGVTNPSETDIRKAIDQKRSSVANVIAGKKARIDGQLKAKGANEKELATIEAVHAKLMDEMHRDIAKFKMAFQTRKQLRKFIPVTLNMQGLTEPVAFFQVVGLMKKQELEALLTHMGLPVAGVKDVYGQTTPYEPGTYIVRESRNMRGESVLELITPFYSPGAARDNIETLMRYLAEHGAKFEGVIKPATYSQINPTATQHVDDVSWLISQKLNAPEAISSSEFEREYTSEANKGRFLFRGQTFATADPSSSYATPTWRPGRTGIVYGADKPSAAIRYATNVGGEVNGLTIDNSYLKTHGGKVVGVVSVFKNSKRNIVVWDQTLEGIKPGKLLKGQITDHQSSETILSPVNNPLVARYLIAGDKMALVDDNDPDWRKILDGLAPDLSVTYEFGIPNTKGVRGNLGYGADFLRLLERLKVEVKMNGGRVKTHDMDMETLTKMGYKKPTGQFQQAAQKLAGQAPAFEMVEQNMLG